MKEFKPDPSKKTVLFAQPYSPAFTPAIEKLRQDPQILVGECVSALDASSAARKAQVCVVLLHVGASEDAKRHIVLQKILGQQIKRGEVRVILTFAQKAELDAKWLASQLSADLVPEPAQVKGLLFKIDRYVKGLPKLGDAAAQDAAASLAKAGAKGKSAQSAHRRNVQALPAQQLPILYTGALKLESDLWLNIKGGIKIQSGRWLVQLKGPGPQFGEWQRYSGPDLKIATEKESKLWVYVPKPIPPELNMGSLIHEEGAWVFLGSQPKFQGNSWYFISAKPVLGFFHDGKPYGNKLELADGVLSIANDSQAAITALNLIEASQAARLEAQRQQQKAAGKGAGAKARASGSESDTTKSTFVMVEPLGLESDCFLILREKPKRVSRKWVVAMMGPPPDTGKWVAVETKEHKTGEPRKRSDDSFWRWEPLDPENDAFIKEQGAWIFRGIQPRFIGRQWIFSAVNPELSFLYEGETYGTKIGTRADGSMAIAKDSQNAMALYPLIEAGLEKIVKSKKKEGGADAETHQVVESGKKGGGSGPSEDAGGEGSKSASKEFRRRASEFGGEGEWSSVHLGSGARQTFMFFPQDLIEGRIEDIRRLPRYWIYVGPEKPNFQETQEREEFVFKGAEPYSVEYFADLPSPLQKTLIQQFSSKEAIREKFAGRGDGEETALDIEEIESNVYSIPKTTFGDEPGSWEVANPGSQSRRWFFFIPQSVDASNPESLRKMGIYWTYFGKSAPRSVSENGVECWSFQVRRPASVRAFGDLPRPVQEYFRDNFGIQLEALPGTEEAKSLEESGDPFATIRGDAAEAAGESEGEESSSVSGGKEHEGSELELERAQGSSGEGVELSGRFRVERREGTELSGTFSKKQGPGSDGEITAESPEGKELEASQSGPGEGVELEGEFGNGESAELSYRSKKKKGASELEISASESGEGQAPELEATQEGVEGAEFNGEFESESESARKSGARNESEAGTPGAEASSPEAGSGVDPKEIAESGAQLEETSGEKASGLPPRARSEAEEAEKNPSERASKSGPGEAGNPSAPEGKSEGEAKGEAEGKADGNAEGKALRKPHALKAGTPQEPTLSPLSVAFLMSELMSKRDEDPSKGFQPGRIANRYCSYVSIAVGGLRVELWVNGTGRWYPAGTFDESPGTLAPLFETLPPELEQSLTPFQGEQALFVPITEKPGASAGSRAIGALVFVGKDADQLIAKWASAIGHMARGLLLTLSLRASLDAPPEAPPDAPPEATTDTLAITEPVVSAA